MTKTFLTVLLLLFFLGACAPPTPLVRPDPPVDPAEQRIESLVDQGRLAEAGQAWLDLAGEHPDQANWFKLRAAEIWLQAGMAHEAAAVLVMIDEQALSRDQRARMLLARAELALLEGDLATAGWLLAHSTDRLPEHLVARHAMLEDLLQRQLENPAREAFSALDQAIRQGDFEPELALALLIEQPLSELQGLQTTHGHRPEMLPWLDLVASARGALLDPAALEVAMNDWTERHPETGYDAEEALNWLASWAHTRPRPMRISIVLPGRPGMEQIGAALRDGLLAAWLEQAPDNRPELTFMYIGDEPEAVMSAWFDAREAGADFMIGPLEREQVDTLLALPDPALPVLMLNHPSNPASFDGVAGPIHAIGLLPEEEAELAAVHALVQGHKRALVLAQDSEWGRRVAPAFTRTFELGGGQAIGQAAYSAGQVDHSALLETLLELDRSEQRARRLAQVINRSVESEPHRRTDVDLIFLGSRAEDGRQIRPQLRFFGAGDVPVLATSQIVAGQPDPRRDEDLEGIILPLAPWFLDFTPQGQQRRQAERVYAHLNNPGLSRLHALGFDAMTLVPWLDLMRNDPDLYLAGLSGRLRLPDGRLMERDLPFVRLVNGRAVPVQ